MPSERELAPERGHARVLGADERRVRGERGQLREVRAGGVEDGQRPLGARDRDVHVQAARQIPLLGGGELVGELPVAVAFRDPAPVRRERVRTGRREHELAAQPVAELENRIGETQPRGNGVAAHGSPDLDLPLAQLGRVPLVVAEVLEHLRAGRRELERLAVEEHELLFQADGRAGSLVEERDHLLDLQRCGLGPLRRRRRAESTADAGLVCRTFHAANYAAVGAPCTTSSSTERKSSMAFLRFSVSCSPSTFSSIAWPCRYLSATFG